MSGSILSFDLLKIPPLQEALEIHTPCHARPSLRCLLFSPANCRTRTCESQSCHTSIQIKRCILKYPHIHLDPFILLFPRFYLPHQMIVAEEAKPSRSRWSLDVTFFPKRYHMLFSPSSKHVKEPKELHHVNSSIPTYSLENKLTIIQHCTE